MSRRDDEIPRRTPILRPRDNGPAPSTGSSGASTTGPETSTDRPQAGWASSQHVARAYTRKQLTGEEPLTLPPPPVVDSVGISDSPGSPVRNTYGRLPEPDVVGVIIAFDRTFTSGTYSYTAIKTPRGWYVTGEGHSRLWTQLLTWIDQGQQEPPAIWVATGWQELTEDREPR